MLVGFSITPLGVGDGGVSEQVAEAIRIVRESGLPNETNAMFTLVEGEWDEVMDVIKRAVDAVSAVAPRVSLQLKADLRSGTADAMHTKLDSLEKKLASTDQQSAATKPRTPLR